MNIAAPLGFDACIAELSRKDPFKAFSKVPTGMLSFWAESIGWPDWLLEGTSHAGSKQLPRRIRMVDDLKATANLIERIGEERLVEMIFEWGRFPGDTAVLSAPDLGSALSFFTANVNRTNPPIDLVLHATADPVRLSMAIDPDIAPFSPIYESTLIAVVLAVVRSFIELRKEGRDILGKVTVGVVRSSPVVAGKFPCRIVRSSQEPFIDIPMDALTRTNPGFNPDFWEGILRQGQTEGTSTNADMPELVRAVEAAVTASLTEHGRILQFAEVARSLDRSQRTLARNLAESGFSYRSIVDRVRLTMAQDLLLHGRLAVHEVAKRLGYGDDTAFVRSFRRHFGVSPARWRRNELLALSQGNTAA